MFTRPVPWLMPRSFGTGTDGGTCAGSNATCVKSEILKLQISAIVFAFDLGVFQHFVDGRLVLEAQLLELNGALRLVGQALRRVVGDRRGNDLGGRPASRPT